MKVAQYWVLAVWWYFWVGAPQAVRLGVDYQVRSQNYYQTYFCWLIRLGHELLAVSVGVLLSYESESHQTGMHCYKGDRGLNEMFYQTCVDNPHFYKISALLTEVVTTAPDIVWRTIFTVHSG